MPDNLNLRSNRRRYALSGGILAVILLLLCGLVFLLKGRPADPACVSVADPDPEAVIYLKVVTLRTENMPGHQDLVNLGLRFRDSDKIIYGVESDSDTPPVLRVFMAANEIADDRWFQEIIERNDPDRPVNLRFLKMETRLGEIGLDSYLERMSDALSVKE